MTELPRMVRARSEAPWTEEEEELLQNRYRAGRSVRELARLHGREPEVIASRLHDLDRDGPPS